MGFSLGNILAPGFSSKGGGDTSIFGGSLDNTWARFTGKYPPTDPKLPAGFEWMGPAMQSMAKMGLKGLPGAMQFNQGITGVGAGAGLGAAGLMGAVNPTALGGALTSGLAGMNTGINTGFAPSISGILSALQPGINYGMDQGAAMLREQNALTGNLSSSGTMKQIADMGAQLQNQGLTNAANIYGNLANTGMGIQADLSQNAAMLPAQYMSAFYNPAMQTGLDAASFPLSVLSGATSGVSGAPLFARQGSSGNGALGGIAASYLAK